MKTFVSRHHDQGNRFVRTLREPAKKELVGVEMFDNFFIENDKSLESRIKYPPQQEPRRIIIEGLGEIEGQDGLFNFSKSFDDFMFKFSFGTQNKTYGDENDEIKIKPHPEEQPLLTTTTTTTTTTAATTTAEDTEITTTSPTPPDTNNVVVENFFPAIPKTLNDLENEIVKTNDETSIQKIEEENDLIQSDASKSHNPPSLAQQLEDYLLVLPLQFRFLRKDSPLLQN